MRYFLKIYYSDLMSNMQSNCTEKKIIVFIQEIFHVEMIGQKANVSYITEIKCNG